MKYVCRKCEKEKEACLFTPGQIANKYPICRLCQADYNGCDYGKTKVAAEASKDVARRTFVAYEKHFDRTFYAKKEVFRSEVQSLVEARKMRLENERRA
jgi:hypothetical protein